MHCGGESPMLWNLIIQDSQELICWEVYKVKLKILIRMLEANVPTSDGACLHSISTLINHKPKKQANVQYKYGVLMSRHDVIQEHALRALRNIRAGEEFFAYYSNNHVT